MGDVSLNPQPLINDEPLTLPATAAKHGGQVGGLISSGWTNERHSSYISSMEASFVDQLYGHPNRGFDVHNRHLGNNEFKVIQESVCKNIKFEKNHPRNLDTRTNGLPENPWVRRFRPRSAGLNGHGICIEAIADDYGSGTEMAQEKVRTHGREVKACTGQNLIGKSKEVSDQNFPDEEVEAGNEPCKKQRPTSSSAAPNDMGT